MSVAEGGAAVEPRWSKLSAAEWVVLCLVSEKPTHSFAVASLLAKDGSLGQVWHVQKAVVYRAAERLVQLGLITAASKQPSTVGPARSQLTATPRVTRRRGTGCASLSRILAMFVPNCWSSSPCWTGLVPIPGTCCNASVYSSPPLLTRSRQRCAPPPDSTTR